MKKSTMKKNDIELLYQEKFIFEENGHTIEAIEKEHKKLEFVKMTSNVILICLSTLLYFSTYNLVFLFSSISLSYYLFKK